MSGSEDEKEAPKLVDYAKNSLFVRNLSPQVSENLLREVFAGVDVIEKITFRAYPNSNSQFFAQVDFASSKGVAEGSRLSGVPILGVPCEIGVIDPIVSQKQLQIAALTGEQPAQPELTDAATQEELQKRITEAAEDQRMRTVHVAGLADGTTREAFERFCKKFGDVERLRVDQDVNGVTFGLVEFAARGPAHIIKSQQQYLVDGRVLLCTEAKTMVDESSFAEQIVQFQAPILDAMNMRQVLSQSGELNQKLAQVRSAAMQITKAKSKEYQENSEEPGSAQLQLEEREKKREREKDREKDVRGTSPQLQEREKKREKEKEREKDKRKRKDGDVAEKEEVKDKKNKKKSKDDLEAEAKPKKDKKQKKKKKKKEKEAEKKQKKKKKKKKEKQKKPKRKVLKEKAAGAMEDDEEEESVVESVSESPSGPVELASEECELVDNTELVVLSASSGSSDEDDEGLSSEAASPAAGSRASPVGTAPAPPREPITIAALFGRWMVGADPAGIWTIGEGGSALFNGRRVKPKWALAPEPNGGGADAIFCQGQREKGWELDMLASEADRLVWRKVGEAEVVWARQLEPFGPAPNPAGPESPAAA